MLTVPVLTAEWIYVICFILFNLNLPESRNATQEAPTTFKYQARKKADQDGGRTRFLIKN